MASDVFHAISIFVKVAEAKSFTEAARRLGMSPSGASKVLTRLEERLGVRLINRTTRSVSLTDDGQAFYERCHQILSELEDAEAALTRRRSTPRGRLRIQVPVGFGRKVLVPLLAQFADLNSELVVDAEFSDRVADLADEGLDAVIRIGELGDARLIAKKLCDVQFVTVAAPAYIATHGEPRSPDELARHRCLAYFIPQTNRYRDWHFATDGRRFPKSISGNLNINNAEALMDAAIAGAGIATVATFVAADAIRSGALRIVMRDYVSRGPSIWVVYLERRHLSLRVRAFVDFLTTNIPFSPPWDDVLKR